jgi:hypothetical protein
MDLVDLAVHKYCSLSCNVEGSMSLKRKGMDPYSIAKKPKAPKSS